MRCARALERRPPLGCRAVVGGVVAYQVTKPFCEDAVEGGICLEGPFAAIGGGFFGLVGGFIAAGILLPES